MTSFLLFYRLVSSLEELQTIGWGSRQTQFQGQAGKASREKIDVDRLPTDIHEWDKSEYNTLISWRGDSQLLATSTVERISHEALRDNHPVLSRRIRIWDRNLQFLSCCDILAGIEPTLTLRHYDLLEPVYFDNLGPGKALF